MQILCIFWKHIDQLINSVFCLYLWPVKICHFSYRFSLILQNVSIQWLEWYSFSISYLQTWQYSVNLIMGVRNLFLPLNTVKENRLHLFGLSFLRDLGKCFRFWHHFDIFSQQMKHCFCGLDPNSICYWGYFELWSS